MDMITEFITHSVQPGTSFAATPTLSMFKEICGIAKQFLARVATKEKRDGKRGVESEEVVLEHLGSEAMARSVPGGSLGSELNPKTTTSIPSDPQFDTQALQGPAPTSLSTSLPDSSPSTTQSGEELPQQPTTNPLLNFAPFLPPESSQFQFDYPPVINPGLYDSLFSSPTGLQWDMTDTWMEGFTSEVWDTGEGMGVEGDADLDVGMGSTD